MPSFRSFFTLALFILSLSMKVTLLGQTAIPIPAKGTPIFQGTRQTENLTDNQKIRLTFQKNLTSGVILKEVKSLNFLNNCTYTTIPPVNQPIPNLWEARLTKLSTPSTRFTLRPSDTNISNNFKANLCTIVVGGKQIKNAFRFEWKGLSKQGINGVFTFVLAVGINANGGSEWFSWMTRENPSVSTETIDEVTCPAFLIKGPIKPGLGEDHLKAQARARVLVPFTADINFTESSIRNLSFYNWVNWFIFGGTTIPKSVTLGHPLGDSDRKQPQSNSQNLQFSAIYSADPSDLVSFRKLLYLGSKDKIGMRKRFHYEGKKFTVQKGEGTEDLGFLLWSHTYICPFFKPPSPFTNDLNKWVPANNADNVFFCTYPIEISIIKAKSEHFWFDACHHYRTFILSESPYIGPKLEENLERGSTLKGTGFIAGYFDRNAPFDPSQYSRDLLTQKALIFASKSKVDRLDPPNVLYLQGHFDGGNGPDLNPNYLGPGYTSIDQTAKDIVPLANDSGILVAAYFRAPAISRNWTSIYPSLPTQDFRIHDIDTNLVDSSFWQLDWRNPKVPAWFLQSIITESISDAHYQGVYLDQLTGEAGSHFSYYPGSPWPKYNFYHGGWQLEKIKREFPERVRQTITSISSSLPFNEEIKPLVLSESTEEFSSNSFDWKQYALLPPPNMIIVDANQFEANLSVTRMGTFSSPPSYQKAPGASQAVSGIARNPIPPLWNIVYHEYGTGSVVLPPLIPIAVGIQNGTYPFHNSSATSGPKGVTWREWTDHICFNLALPYISGMGFSFSDFPNFAPRAFWLNSNGTLSFKDPTTGQELVHFLSTLIQSQERSYGGQFISLGRYERPLLVNYDGVSTTWQNNPEANLFIKCSQKLSNGNIDPRSATYFQTYCDPYAPPQTSPLWTFKSLGAAHVGSYLVPEIYHSVWRSPEGLLGIVFVNWSNHDANFDSVFDPSLYGISGNFSIKRLTQPQTRNGLVTGSLISGASNLVGPQNLTIGLNKGIKLLGAGNKMPKRSILIITIQ